MNDRHVLRIECADRKGLIHAITGVVLKEGLNIVSNAEYVDRAAGRFFMRTECSGKPDSKRMLARLKAALPQGAVIELVRARKKNVVLFATKEPHCLGDLLLRHASGELGADILAVISNHADLKKLVSRFGVPYHFVTHEKKTRERHEDEIARILKKLKPDYLVLAKYMRILSPGFSEKFAGRIINIHHSFLPAFVGANPYQQAADRGVKIIGATAHFVNEELDKGPIIAQSVIPVDHSHSVQDMAQAGRDIEKIVLAKALKLAFEDRIFVDGHRTVIFD